METYLAYFILFLFWLFAFVPGVGHCLDEGNRFFSKSAGYGECFGLGILAHIFISTIAVIVTAFCWAVSTVTGQM